MGVRRIFSRGGQWGAWKTKVPSRVQGSFPVGCEGLSPRSWRHFLKMMHKYFVYWGFRQHLQQKKTLFNISSGRQVSPLPILAGDHIVLGQYIKFTSIRYASLSTLLVNKETDRQTDSTDYSIVLWLCRGGQLTSLCRLHLCRSFVRSNGSVLS